MSPNEAHHLQPFLPGCPMKSEPGVLQWDLYQGWRSSSWGPTILAKADDPVKKNAAFHWRYFHTNSHGFQVVSPKRANISPKILRILTDWMNPPPIKRTSPLHHVDCSSKIQKQQSVNRFKHVLGVTITNGQLRELHLKGMWRAS